MGVIQFLYSVRSEFEIASLLPTKTLKSTMSYICVLQYGTNCALLESL